MSRLPEVNRDAVPQELRAAFDELISASGGEVPLGPGSVAAMSPEMALRRRPMSNYVRWELKLSQSVQEVVILATARAMDCRYVWNAHAPMARRVGISDELIDAIRDRAPLPSVTAEESAALGLVTGMLENHDVPDEVFSAVMGQFGLQNTIDLIALIGQYVTNAGFIDSFKLELPETSEPLLPV